MDGEHRLTPQQLACLRHKSRGSECAGTRGTTPPYFTLMARSTGSHEIDGWEIVAVVSLPRGEPCLSGAVSLSNTARMDSFDSSLGAYGGANTG